MKFYFDSSLLVKLYYPEDLSDAVTEMVKKRKSPVIFSSLHELEIKNAVALKVFREEMPDAQAEMFFDDLNNDLKTGVLARLHLDWGEVFTEALKLSAAHTKSTGARALDILHIAAAQAVQCTHFITHDKRQAETARIAGMHVRLL